MTQGQIPFVQGPAPAVAPAQQFVPPVQQQTQQGGAFQQPSGQQWPAQGSQQVQQPGPFAPTPAGPAGSPGWPQTNAAQTAATTSPSEAPATGRRKRRTQAEIAAAGSGQPAGPQQAPFPHPGQQAQLALLPRLRLPVRQRALVRRLRRDRLRRLPSLNSASAKAKTPTPARRCRAY